MQKTIKKIMIEDLDKLGIIFNEHEILNHGICNNDKIEVEDLLIEDGKL